MGHKQRCSPNENLRSLRSEGPVDTQKSRNTCRNTCSPGENELAVVKVVQGFIKDAKTGILVCNIAPCCHIRFFGENVSVDLVSQFRRK